MSTTTKNALADWAEGVLAPLVDWACQCHAASLKLVRQGDLGACRVARGSCAGVGGQHSWVVLGDDCYDKRAVIIDPTLWSYDENVPLGVWVGTYRKGKHHPHGEGSIWEWGRPNDPTGPIMKLTPRKPFSESAKSFLQMLGPLDKEGWALLAHAPVQFWPAGEILDAIYHTEGLSAYVPIDIIGMTTSLNPNGLYLPEKSP